MKSESVAFLGLGVMGYPMAGHLHRAGQKVRVYNRTAAKAEKFAAEHPGAEWFSTPGETAVGADFVFSCVGNDDDLRAVTVGAAGAFAGMSAGAIFVDHTTASAEVARELHVAGAERGLGFIDAPISGGQAGAEKGALTVMCGGDPSIFAKAEPVIACYARACRLMGPPGAGQLTKMVNQIAIAGLVQSLAEALHFAGAAGLDAENVIDLLKNGAAQSWQMENRTKTMLAGEFDFGFAV
ncbi:MAG: NAD(P)-dependent oxidoreductase, partial [Methylocystis sp.]